MGFEGAPFLKRLSQEMNQGRIIEYIDQGKVACALCLHDRGSRLHLLTPLNRQVNLAPKRAILVSSGTMESGSTREEILNRLKQLDLLREKLKGEISVRDLWDLIREEKESFDYKYLAQLCFGEQVTDDHVSALVRALFEDKTYFKMKDGRFVPHSEDKVEQIIREREEEALREEDLKRSSAWLKEALEHGAPGTGEEKERVVEVLIQLALHGKEARDYKFGKDLLSLAGVTDTGEARTLLVRLGVWEEDEPVDILRFEIRNSFTEDLIQESLRLKGGDMAPTGREDLRDLNVFTIDGPLTLDFDDAISMGVRDDHIEIGVHIADVSSVITPGSGLDLEACLRGSSLYLPRRQIPMFPDDLSHDRLSLKRGVDRPAISLLALFDREGDLMNYRFTPSLINVKSQLTYDQVNEQYEGEDRFPLIYGLCEKLRQKRVEKGALILSLPEVSIDVNDDSSVSIELVSQETRSRMMVAELMILYNWLAARFCMDNNIPILFRGQKEPSERLSIDETGYIYYVFRQRRKLNPLVIDIEPTPHAGLGLDAYSNLSSPIRRYFDLVCQRQISNFLFKGSPVYNREELEKVRLNVTPLLKDLETVKRNRLRYWIQKHLQARIGVEFPGIVLDVMKSRCRIILTDYLFVSELKREAGKDFSPGMAILVRVLKSDPWNGILRLEYVGRP